MIPEYVVINTKNLQYVLHSTLLSADQLFEAGFTAFFSLQNGFVHVALLMLSMLHHISKPGQLTLC